MGRSVHRFEAAVLSSLALGTGAAVAPAGTTFSDPAGDVQGGAGPDLVSLSVSHTPPAVRFRFRFATAPPLGASARAGWVDMLLVGIDVPPRALERGARGWTGLDYYAGLHGAQRTAILFRRRRPSPGRGRS